MAKRKSLPSKARRTVSTQGLDTLADLRQIERQLLSLLNSHARLVRRLAESSSSKNRRAVEEQKTQDRLARLVASGKNQLSTSTLKRIFFELSNAEDSLVHPARVAYLGPMYSYSHLAAMQRFSQDAELIPVATISTVFEDVDQGRVSFGLVPLENSTDGRSVDTLGMFAKLPVQICGEVQLRIHHNLLAKGTSAKIREIYSKPQALSQCREWLTRHFPQARLVDAASTTEAAQMAAGNSAIAAIASRQAAGEYGLGVLAANIEDNPDNITRFAVIGEAPGKRTNADKTSLMFEISHRPGALADVMTTFKRSRLNLTWIESFPLPGSPQEYLFFVEHEGHHAESKVKRALVSLRGKTVRLEILGSYPVSPPVDELA